MCGQWSVVGSVSWTYRWDEVSEHAEMFVLKAKTGIIYWVQGKYKNDFTKTKKGKSRLNETSIFWLFYISKSLLQGLGLYYSQIRLAVASQLVAVQTLSLKYW